MYLECRHCGNPNIDLVPHYNSDMFTSFYCPDCKTYIGPNDVKQYYSLATHYTNTNFKSILVTDKQIR